MNKMALISPLTELEIIYCEPEPWNVMAWNACSFGT